MSQSYRKDLVLDSLLVRQNGLRLTGSSNTLPGILQYNKNNKLLEGYTGSDDPLGNTWHTLNREQASDTKLGSVKIGSNITITDGIIENSTKGISRFRQRVITVSQVAGAADYTSITDALEYLDDLSSQDDDMKPSPSVLYTIEVAPGTYTESITVPSYVSLNGTSKESVIIKSTSSGSVITLSSYVDVSGITIIIDSDNITGYNYGIYGSQVSYVNLNNIKINISSSQSNNLGIYFSDSSSICANWIQIFITSGLLANYGYYLARTAITIVQNKIVVSAIASDTNIGIYNNQNNILYNSVINNLISDSSIAISGGNLCFGVKNCESDPHLRNCTIRILTPEDQNDNANVGYVLDNEVGNDTTGIKIVSPDITFQNVTVDNGRDRILYTGSTYNFLTLGFRRNQVIKVSGSDNEINNRYFTLADVTTNTLILNSDQTLLTEVASAEITITQSYTIACDGCLLSGYPYALSHSSDGDSENNKSNFATKLGNSRIESGNIETGNHLVLYREWETIVVATEDGDFNTLSSAVDSIIDNSSFKPYLIRVQPGRYTETSPIELKSYIAVVGTDPENTVLSFELSGTSIDVSSSCLTIVSNSSVSGIQILHNNDNSNSENQYVQLVYGSDISQSRFEDVKLVSTGLSRELTGIYLRGSDLNMNNIRINITARNNNSVEGVYFENSSSIITNLDINISGPSTDKNQGIHSVKSNITLTSSYISVEDSSINRGIYLNNDDSEQDYLFTIEGSEIGAARNEARSIYIEQHYLCVASGCRLRGIRQYSTLTGGRLKTNCCYEILGDSSEYTYQSINSFGASQSSTSTSVFFEGAGNETATGVDNTAAGYGAGINLTSGSSNTFIGSDAGQATTSGSCLTITGASAGYSNTSGNNNTFYGRESAYSNTDGNNLTFVGYQTGYNSVSVDDNVMLGALAGYSNTTGTELVFIGQQTGYSNTTGSDNVFIGRGTTGASTGYNNTTGSRNVFVGSDSGASNISANNNVYLGHQSGTNMTTENNTLIGSRTGYNTTSGQHITILGFESGYSNIEGNNLSFIGYRAGYNNLTSQNVFIGTYAGYSNSTGTRNVFVGSVDTSITNNNSAGYSNTSGHDNIFLGGGAGSSNLVSHYNIFVGRDAGQSNTTGFRNIALGYGAGQNNMTGSDNVSIGIYAASSSTSLNQDLSIGYYAGHRYTGNSSMFLGYRAGHSVTNTDESIYIGADAGRKNSGDIEGLYNIVIGDTIGSSMSNASRNIFVGSNIYGATLTDCTQVGFNAGYYSGGIAKNNTYLGYNVGYSTTGTVGNFDNIFIGTEAGRTGTNPYYETYIGYRAGYSLGSRSANVMIGYRAASNTTGSDKNLAIGSYSLYSTPNTDGTVSIGYKTGFQTLGQGNIYLGYQSGYGVTTGAYNMFIGSQTGVGGDDPDGDSPSINDITGSYNIITGTRAGYNMVNIDKSIFMGYQAGYSSTTGNSNIMIGDNAGYNNTTGHRNVIIGSSDGDTNSGAGYSNTTGYDNVMIGFESGFSNTTGYNNFVLGSRAGYNNTDGLNNIFIGAESGYGFTTGNQNITFGTEAGNSYLSGDNNIFIGYQAGHGDSTDNKSSTIAIGYKSGFNNNADRNLFIGYLGGYLNTTGQDNVFIGTTAGFGNTTGSSGIMIGKSAGYNSETGDNNIYLGTESGYAGSSGTGNLSVGNEALRNNQTGDYNIALGTEAGRNTLSSSNIYIGKEAGRNTNTGATNIAIGDNSLYSNATGSFNIAMGFYAGYNSNSDSNLFIGPSSGFNNTTGTPNVFIGESAGFNNTTGNQIVAIGSSAGISNTTGTLNIFIGSEAGYNNNIGQGNMFIGYKAGYNNVAGNNNLIMGYESGNSLQNVDSALFIGYRAGFSSVNADYATVIGYNALKNFSNTSDSGNTVIGSGAFSRNRKGLNNLVIGSQSMMLGNVSDKNTTIGWQSGGLVNSQLYTENVSIGARAGRNAFDSTQSVYIGSACREGAGGKFNVAIGNDSGKNMGKDVVISLDVPSQTNSGSTTIAINATSLIKGQYISIIHDDDTIDNEIVYATAVSGCSSANISTALASNLTTSDEVYLTFGEDSTSLEQATSNSNSFILVKSPNAEISNMFSSGDIITVSTLDSDSLAVQTNLTFISSEIYSGNSSSGTTQINIVGTAPNNFVEGDPVYLARSYTSAIGRLDNTIGSANVFIGRKSGEATTTGYKNIAIGNEALKDNISGQYNVCIGNDSGEKVKSSGNITIGTLAGSNIDFNGTGGTGNNICVGPMAGLYAGRAGTASNSNVFIGPRAGQLTDGDNNFMIGVEKYPLSTYDFDEITTYNNRFALYRSQYSVPTAPLIGADMNNQLFGVKTINPTSVLDAHESLGMSITTVTPTSVTLSYGANDPLYWDKKELTVVVNNASATFLGDGVALIDSEIINYADLTGGSFDFNLNDITRNTYNTSLAHHNNGTLIYDLMHIEAVTTLTNNMTNIATTLTVDSQNNLSESGILIIGSEIITYNLNGGIFTLTRGTNNTTATSHANGDQVVHVAELVPVSNLSNNITNSQTVIELDSIGAIAGSSDRIKINEEIIFFGNKGRSLAGLSRGLYGSDSNVEHSVGTTVFEQVSDFSSSMYIEGVYSNSSDVVAVTNSNGFTSNGEVLVDDEFISYETKNISLTSVERNKYSTGSVGINHSSGTTVRRITDRNSTNLYNNISNSTNVISINSMSGISPYGYARIGTELVQYNKTRWSLQVGTRGGYNTTPTSHASGTDVTCICQGASFAVGTTLLDDNILSFTTSTTLASSGTVRIGGEIISYTTSGNTLYQVCRAHLGTTVASHLNGKAIYDVDTFNNAYPLTVGIDDITVNIPIETTNINSAGYLVIGTETIAHTNNHGYIFSVSRGSDSSDATSHSIGEEVIKILPNTDSLVVTTPDYLVVPNDSSPLTVRLNYADDIAKNVRYLMVDSEILEVTQTQLSIVDYDSLNTSKSNDLTRKNSLFYYTEFNSSLYLANPLFGGTSTGKMYYGNRDDVATNFSDTNGMLLAIGQLGDKEMALVTYTSKTSDVAGLHFNGLSLYGGFNSSGHLPFWNNMSAWETVSIPDKAWIDITYNSDRLLAISNNSSDNVVVSTDNGDSWSTYDYNTSTDVFQNSEHLFFSATSNNNILECSVIDSSDAYGYFGGTHQGNAIIRKIDLSTFTQTSTLNISGETNLKTAVIDSTDTFAYFAVDNGELYKINLSSFTSTASLTLGTTGNVTSSFILPDDTFAYFTCDNGRCCQVNLSSYAINQTITLTHTNNAGASGMISDGTKAGFGATHYSSFHSQEMWAFQGYNLPGLVYIGASFSTRAITASSTSIPTYVVGGTNYLYAGTPGGDVRAFSITTSVQNIGSVDTDSVNQVNAMVITSNESIGFTGQDINPNSRFAKINVLYNGSFYTRSSPEDSIVNSISNQDGGIYTMTFDSTQANIYAGTSNNSINGSSIIKIATKSEVFGQPTAIAYSNSANIYAVSSWTGSNRMRISNDGSSWTSYTVPDGQWTDIAFGSGLGFVAVSNGGSNRVISSPNAAQGTWTVRTGQAGTWKSVAYGNGRFVAVEDGGINDIMYSTNLSTWSVPTFPVTGDWKSVAYGDGRFVAVGTDKVMVMSASNVEQWTEGTIKTQSWTNVKYADDVFIATATTGDERIAWSSDGLTWNYENVSSIADANWQATVVGDDHIFTIGQNSNTSNLIRKEYNPLRLYEIENYSDGSIPQTTLLFNTTHNQSIAYVNGQSISGFSEMGTGPKYIVTNGDTSANSGLFQYSTITHTANRAVSGTETNIFYNSSFYHVASIQPSTTLRLSMTNASTLVGVNNLDSFGSEGKILVGSEIISYSSGSGLIVSERAALDTTSTTHLPNSSVYPLTPLETTTIRADVGTGLNYFPLASGTNFRNFGEALIGSEVIYYGNKNSYDNLTRGVLGTSASQHNAGNTGSQITYNNPQTLRDNITNSQTYLPLDNSNIKYSGDSGLVLIDSEFIPFSSKNTMDFVTRGVFGTIASSHSSGDIIRETSVLLDYIENGSAIATLSKPTTLDDTVISVVDHSTLSSSGYAVIDNELISYSNKDLSLSVAINGRGFHGTTATAHNNSSDVVYVAETTSFALSESLLPGDTVAFGTTTSLVSSGTVRIDGEIITYASSGNTLMTANRAQNSSTAVMHCTGTTVYQISSMYTNYSLKDNIDNTTLNIPMNTRNISSYGILIIGNEHIEYTDNKHNLFDVTRGEYGTTAESHDDGDTITYISNSADSAIVSSTLFTEMNGTTTRIQMNHSDNLTDNITYLIIDEEIVQVDGAQININSTTALETNKNNTSIPEDSSLYYTTLTLSEAVYARNFGGVSPCGTSFIVVDDDSNYTQGWDSSNGMIMVVENTSKNIALMTYTTLCSGSFGGLALYDKFSVGDRESYWNYFNTNWTNRTTGFSGNWKGLTFGNGQLMGVGTSTYNLLSHPPVSSPVSTYTDLSGRKYSVSSVPDLINFDLTSSVDLISDGSPNTIYYSHIATMEQNTPAIYATYTGDGYATTEIHMINADTFGVDANSANVSSTIFSPPIADRFNTNLYVIAKNSLYSGATDRLYKYNASSLATISSIDIGTAKSWSYSSMIISNNNNFLYAIGNDASGNPQSVTVNLGTFTAGGNVSITGTQGRLGDGFADPDNEYFIYIAPTLGPSSLVTDIYLNRVNMSSGVSAQQGLLNGHQARDAFTNIVTDLDAKFLYGLSLGKRLYKINRSTLLEVSNTDLTATPSGVSSFEAKRLTMPRQGGFVLATFEDLPSTFNNYRYRTHKINTQSMAIVATYNTSEGLSDSIYGGVQPFRNGENAYSLLLEKELGSDVNVSMELYNIQDGARIDMTDIAYGNGTFAIVGSYNNQVLTTTNGDSFTIGSVPEGQWQSIVYGDRFVAVADGGTNNVMTSPDGITWTARTGQSGQWTSVTYGNGNYVAVSDGGSNRVMTSPDGITWTTRTADAEQWQAVSYGNGQFVAVGNGSAMCGASYMMVSDDDGVSWSSVATFPSGTWRDIIYTDKMFVAGRTDGFNKLIEITGDATNNNTSFVSGQTGPRESLAYGNGMICAVGSTPSIAIRDYQLMNVYQVSNYTTSIPTTTSTALSNHGDGFVSVNTRTFADFHENGKTGNKFIVSAGSGIASAQLYTYNDMSYSINRNQGLTIGSTHTNGTTMYQISLISPTINLNGDIDNLVDDIPVDNISGSGESFPTSGKILIESEIISYNSGHGLIAVTRGFHSTSPVSHNNNDNIIQANTAGNISNTLRKTVTSTSEKIPLVDGSSFLSSGLVLIGNESVFYDNKNSYDDLNRNQNGTVWQGNHNLANGGTQITVSTPSTLREYITSSNLYVPVDNRSGYTASTGLLLIDSEFISYDGKTTLDNVIRGWDATNPKSHNATTDVTQVSFPSNLTLRDDLLESYNYVPLENSANVIYYANFGVVLIDQEYIGYDARSSLDILVRGLYNTTASQHNDVNAVQVVYNGYSTLRIGMTNDSQFVPLTDSSFYSTSGVVRIDNEFISYTNKNTLDDLIRGNDGTNNTEHCSGTAVYYLTGNGLSTLRSGVISGNRHVRSDETSGLSFESTTSLPLTGILYSERFGSLNDSVTNGGTPVAEYIIYGTKQTLNNIDRGAYNTTVSNHSIGTPVILVANNTSTLRSNTLSATITNSTTTIAITDASSFDSSGSIIIGAEVVLYQSKSSNTLQNCIRGTLSTTKTAHTNGSTVYQVPPISATSTLCAGVDTDDSLMGLVSSENFSNSGTILVGPELMTYQDKEAVAHLTRASGNSTGSDFYSNGDTFTLHSVNLDLTHRTILADTASDDFTTVLPNASAATRREYTIKKISALNTLTVEPESGETIDGQNNISLVNQYAYVTVQSDGNEWFIIGRDGF